MAILILKHNALTPYANFEGAKNGIIEKMESAQQGELWAAEYFTASGEGVEESKGAILAFKGKNGIVTFTDGNKMSEEMKKELSEYYTKDEIDELLNTKLADYYTKDEVDAALDTKIGKEDVMMSVSTTSTNTVSGRYSSNLPTEPQWEAVFMPTRRIAAEPEETSLYVEWTGGRFNVPLNIEHKLSFDNDVLSHYVNEDGIWVLSNTYNTSGQLKLVPSGIDSITVYITKPSELNTKNSLEYLNDNKADKDELNAKSLEILTEVEAQQNIITDLETSINGINTTLESKADKEYVDTAIDSVVKSAIGVVGGDGIVISGEGTEKTISTNVELEIKTVDGKEMIQLLDATDNSKVLAEVDASKFVVDGMLDSASIVTINDETELPEGVELPNGKYIKLTWNTDAGKSDTYVAVADLISEHKVVAGEDVAGEMVIVATNVVESTDENGIKVSTVNVSVDDTAVQSALDTKIGKEDAMLEFKDASTEQTILYLNGNYTISGNSWVCNVFELGTMAFCNFKLSYASNMEVIKEFAESTYSVEMIYNKPEDGVSVNQIKFVYNNGETEEYVNVIPNQQIILTTYADGEGTKISFTTNINSYLNTKSSFEYLTNKMSLLDTKIGKEDVMLNGYIVRSVEYVLNQENESLELNTSLWDITMSSMLNSCTYELKYPNGEVICTFHDDTMLSRMGTTLIITHVGKTQEKLTLLNYAWLILKLKTVGDDYIAVVTVTSKVNSELNTKESLTVLEQNKVDKLTLAYEVESLFTKVDNSKVGKYDTVLSVNDGETNTDYNVEGALEYLNNEIKAMTVIDCGVF